MSKKGVIRAAAAAALLIPAGYIAVQVFPVLFRGYELQTAVTAVVSDSVEVRGVAVRSETAIAVSSAGGVYGYLYEDGTRVSSGSEVLKMFQSEQQAQNSALADSLTQEIKMLELSQSQSLTGNTDVDKILSQQQTGISSLISLIDSGSWQKIDEAKSVVALASNKLEAAMGKTADYSARIAELTQQRDSAAAAEGTVQTVSMPAPGGYYSSMTDGMEQTLTEASADAMTAEEIRALAESGSSSMSAGAGKIVSSYDWYFYCTADDATAARFESVTGSVTVNFETHGSESIPAQVVSVQRDAGGGTAKIKLLCSYVNSSTVNLRAQVAEISFREYTGIRIPASAVHFVTQEDGTLVRGVYIKYGNVIRFKKISPVFENDQFVVVPSKTSVGTDDESKKNEVLLYDEIITSGRDLSDGKLI